MFNSFITSNMPYFLSLFQPQRVHPKSSLFFNISKLYEIQGITIVWRRRYESCVTQKCCMGFWLFCMLCSRHVLAMSLPNIWATSSLFELGLRRHTIWLCSVADDFSVMTPSYDNVYYLWPVSPRDSTMNECAGPLLPSVESWWNYLVHWNWIGKWCQYDFVWISKYLRKRESGPFQGNVWRKR
jgi:hypothetical protein